MMLTMKRHLGDEMDDWTVWGPFGPHLNRGRRTFLQYYRTTIQLEIDTQHCFPSVYSFVFAANEYN